MQRRRGKGGEADTTLSEAQGPGCPPRAAPKAFLFSFSRPQPLGNRLVFIQHAECACVNECVRACVRACFRIHIMKHAYIGAAVVQAQCSRPQLSLTLASLPARRSSTSISRYCLFPFPVSICNPLSLCPSVRESACAKRMPYARPLKAACW